GGGVMLALALCSALPAQAFVLGGTRVILREGNVSTLAVVGGEKDGVLLVRARVGRDVALKEHAPELLVSPPVFRLEKGGRNQLRLSMVNAAGLPHDRESVRYLSVSGIPSSNPLSPDRGKTQAGMVIGQGAVIKVFWRPAGLAAPTDKVWGAVTATRVPGGIELANPTPYYMSFSILMADGKPMTPAKDAPSMLAPFSHQMYGTKIGRAHV